jgi:stage II sporulation protein D
MHGSIDIIRKQVPVLSLVACTGLLVGAWRFTTTDVAPLPLAVKSPAQATQRTIRVGVMPEPARTVSIEISGPFRIRPVGSDKLLFEGSKLASTNVTATAKGIKLGKRELAATRVEIIPTDSPAVWVDGHQYRGRVRLFRQPGGLVLAVNVLPLEDYIASVVDSEMPADFPDEARQAQAIVARTYAVYQMKLAGPNAVLDLYASTRSQKYLGFQYRATDGRLLAGESAASRRISAATDGRICTYRGEVFCTYYCAVCGGMTVRGTDVFSDSAPPLQPVPCNWCKDARLYRWTANISKRDLQADLDPLLRRDGNQPGPLNSVSVVRAKGKDALPEFDLRAERQTVRVTGAELRQALVARGLYSSRFTVEDKGKTFLISGRGHGHGVGLCQWGARGLAIAGKNCDQILQYYYPGAKVTKLR